MNERKELGLQDLVMNQPSDLASLQEVDPIELKGKKKVEGKNVLFDDAFGSLMSVTERIQNESDRFLEEKKEYEIEEEINSDVNNDLEEDDYLDNEEVVTMEATNKPKTSIKVVDRDIEDEKIEDLDEEELDEDVQFKQLQKVLKNKVKPIKNKIDINSFKISKKPVSVSNALKASSQSLAVSDWALFNMKKPISISELSGTEIHKLNPQNSTANLINTYREIYTIIYDHVVDTNKPRTMEEWLKSIYYKDRDHLFFGVYKASFANSNYIPYECPECKHIFVTEDVSIDDMVKYKDDETKTNAKEILEGDTTTSTNDIEVELTQISDNYIIGLKNPSIYEVIFENIILADKVREKYAYLLEMLSYIDEIYLIDYENNELRPVELKVYPNDLAKTVKEKIVKYSKIIQSMSSDELNTLRAYISEKDKENIDNISYVIPATSCEKCKKEIKEEARTAEAMLFTRHQLATIANI